ncbi:MAG: cytochrome d ubiquinol oxidase subunit II [Deltaproteobacteria bacterium]|nr:cytochrome d ubiquinol oxidase subunit II [Deltaproteobacteria bacterium]
METFWFFATACMLAAYVVLDGFDLGAGALHLFLARTDQERRAIYASIGPVWDGNEVWLLAGGGTLFFAFPQAYAAGFSGFYLPLMLVLWLLAGRALSIELRSHLPYKLWHAFWDAAFCLSSALLCVVLGAALGNVIRGVPLTSDGWFHVALFTDFRLGAYPGVLDWYTVLIGVFALLALSAHGALWISLKTEGDLQARAKAFLRRAWPAVGALGIVAIVATQQVQPTIYSNLLARPLAWPLVLIAALGFGACLRRVLRTSNNPTSELIAFCGSAAFLTGTLAASAAGLFPVLLRSTVDPVFSITAHSAATAQHGQRVGLAWWLVGLPIAIAYAVIMYRSTRGKVSVPERGH